MRCTLRISSQMAEEQVFLDFYNCNQVQEMHKMLNSFQDTTDNVDTN